jgi:hypothetical protein
MTSPGVAEITFLSLTAYLPSENLHEGNHIASSLVPFDREDGSSLTRSEALWNRVPAGQIGRTDGRSGAIGRTLRIGTVAVERSSSFVAADPDNWKFPIQERRVMEQESPEVLMDFRVRERARRYRCPPRL